MPDQLWVLALVSHVVRVALLAIGVVLAVVAALEPLVWKAAERENFVADVHAAEIISRGKITHPGPTGLLFFDQIAPGIRIRF